MTTDEQDPLQVLSDTCCFVCGPDNPHGLKACFRIDRSNRAAEAVLTLPPDFQGWQGIVHGGIISALLDEAAIYACRPLSLHAVTAGLSVRFRKPVPTGSEVNVRAEIVSVRRQIADVKSTLATGSDIMAEAEVRVKLIDEFREEKP